MTFNQLPLFQDAKEHIQLLSPAIAHIGSVLCALDIEKEIGVNLLHRHFDMNQDEYLVKHIHPEKSIIRPERCTDALPYIFHAGEKWIMTEFVSTDSGCSDALHRGRKAIERNSEALRACIHNLGVSQDLGLFIRHQPFDPGTSYLEKSIGERQLILEKVPTHQIDPHTSTQTNWYFEKHADPNHAGYCGICCAIHCGVHCGWHG